MASVCHAQGEDPRLLERALELTESPLHLCELNLEIREALLAQRQNCKPMDCDRNVSKIMAHLPPDQRERARILIIAPTNVFTGFISRAALTHGRGWNFHAVVLLEGRVLDPDDEFNMRPLKGYMHEMFRADPSQVGIWSLTQKEHLELQRDYGWSYLFMLRTREPTVRLDRHRHLVVTWSPLDVHGRKSI